MKFCPLNISMVSLNIWSRIRSVGPHWEFDNKQFYLGSLVRTNDDNCPLSRVETPEYAVLTREDCGRRCLNDSNCMAYRWHQQSDRQKFKPCEVWFWTEKDSCKEISHCISGSNQKECLKTEDARIFIKTDKCNEANIIRNTQC